MISLEKKLQWLNEIGILLSSEHESKKLLNQIILSAKYLTCADGGTIYTVTKYNTLHFEIICNDSLNYHFISGEGEQSFTDIPLATFDQQPNHQHIVAHAVNAKKSVNIEDAYEHEGFDFSGTRAFDENTGYRTQSVLTVPLINQEGRVIAALQLINAKNPETQQIIPFSLEDQKLAESLASQAAVFYTNQHWMEQFKQLFHSFVRMISDAIDEKSPSTGNHGKRVPVLAVMLAEAVNETHSGPLKDVHFSKEDIYEIELAALLHDCGKIVTPTHIVEKRHKLETIVDRIDLVKERLEKEKREREIALLEKKIKECEKDYLPKEVTAKVFSDIRAEMLKIGAEVEAELNFIRRCNEGTEVIDHEALEKLKKLTLRGILSQDEYNNLSIPEGNLTLEERKIMEHHVEVTFDMLAKLPFPQELERVPRIAAAHHERVDGKGYPYGLTKDEMPIQARILAIADVFEALSAPDRPYKPALPLSTIYQIMEKKVKEGHLDSDLFAIFMQKNVGLHYAEKYLVPEQIDIPHYTQTT